MQKIPLLGMGTWGMGGKYERDDSNVDASVEALRYGLSLGMNLIDVAELYGEGLTEEIVGKAIDGKNREDVHIVSKVWKENLHYDDVMKSVEGSLKRLKTSYIDLYLVHWPNPDIPLKETMEALENLYQQKKIRAIGVSNFDVPLLKEAEGYLKLTHISANQIEYNLGSQRADVDIIPYCTEQHIRVMAHRPFAKGALAKTASEKVTALAKKYNKTPNQIALNWIISQGITAVPMSMNHAHLKENAGALGWEMLKEDIVLLTSAT